MNLSQATYVAIDKSKKKQVLLFLHTHRKYHSVVQIKGHMLVGRMIQQRGGKNLSMICVHLIIRTKRKRTVNNPPQTGEELYTAVKKKPQNSIPVNEPTLHGAEDLHTAVIKKPKESSTDGEAAPPIPSHTIEELYTAVQKAKG